MNKGTIVWYNCFFKWCDKRRKDFYSRCYTVKIE